MTGGGSLKHLENGQFLFHEGDPYDGIYLIKAGLVEIVKLREGTILPLATLKTGDVIGTITMFSREPRTAGARAQTPTTLLHIPAEHLEKALKDEVPVWAQAVIKDTIARIKHVDEQLVKALLREKAQARTQLGPFQHSGQLANLLATLYRRDVVQKDGEEFFPIKGFIETAELVLFQRAEYWEKIFDVFIKNGLVKRIENKKYGPSLNKLRPTYLEDFGVFVANVGKVGIGGFIPLKFHALLQGLLRLHRAHPQRDSWPQEDLMQALSKDTGREVGDEHINQLVSFAVLRRLPGAAGFAFGAQGIQKKLVYENVCRGINDLKVILGGSKEG